MGHSLFANFAGRASLVGNRILDFQSLASLLLCHVAYFARALQNCMQVHNVRSLRPLDDALSDPDTHFLSRWDLLHDASTFSLVSLLTFPLLMFVCRDQTRSLYINIIHNGQVRC